VSQGREGECNPRIITLTLLPQARFDVIDVAQKVAVEFDDVLTRYRKALYCSYHTTAGYLETESVRQAAVQPGARHPLIRAFQKLFPREPTTATTSFNCEPS